MFLRFICLRLRTIVVLKKPRSCILRDRSLLQLTEVSDAYRHFPITNFFWFGISDNAFPLKKVCTLMRTLMRTLIRLHRVCECFSLGLPFLKRLYSNVCYILLCIFSLTNIGFAQRLSLGPLFIYVMSFSITLCCFNSFLLCISFRLTGRKINKFRS